MEPLVLTLLLIVAAAIWFARHRARRMDFWKVAARYPDWAYDWFTHQSCWVVVDPEVKGARKPDGDEFIGPHILRVPKLGGRRVAVWGRRDKAAASQRAFLEYRGLRSSEYMPEVRVKRR